MNLDQAWKKYLEDVEEVRQLFIVEPMFKENPAMQAAAISLLHQTIALSYNSVMAPRQDFPIFQLQTYIEPYAYLGHLPCPDFVYRLVFLNGARTWRIWGKRNTTRWTDIQVHTGHWGEPGYDIRGNYDIDEFQIAANGQFEIIASTSPHPGNWIKLDGDSGNNVFLIRQSTYDWENEVPIEFNIEAMDELPSASIVLGVEEVIRRLDLAGRMMKHCVRIWTAPASRRLLRNVPVNELLVVRGDGKRGASPLAQYAQGIFEIGDDEALIIETAIPNAKYWSIHLGNWWWETLDYSSHKSSINGFQAVPDEDGRFRAVIARRDPGVPNWLDPIAWNTGLIMIRWYKADSDLVVKTTRVPLADLCTHLPAETPSVDSTQRKREIRGRHAGTLRLYGY